MPQLFFQNMLVQLPKITLDIQKESNLREMRLFLDILVFGLKSQSLKISLYSIRILQDLSQSIPKFIFETLQSVNLPNNLSVSLSQKVSYHDLFLHVC